MSATPSDGEGAASSAATCVKEDFSHREPNVHNIPVTADDELRCAASAGCKQNKEQREDALAGGNIKCGDNMRPAESRFGTSFISSVRRRLQLDIMRATKGECSSQSPHKLRCLTISSSKQVMYFMDVLDELLVDKAHMVRLADVSGQVLHVICDPAKNSPVASLSLSDGVSTGRYFTIKLLYDRVPLLGDGGFSKCINERYAVSSSEVVSRVPRWVRYCVMTTLYLALAEAGFCDEFNPLVSLQWMNWNDLLQSQAHLRLDLMSNPSTRYMRQPQLGCGRSEKVPVAVFMPTTMKGKLRRIYENCGQISLSSDPFTDAEVFQLFYIQLVFRAAYNVIFGDMMKGEKNNILRSDLIAAQSSGRQPLAFEHPKLADKWLMFPAHSQILHICHLEGALIPSFTSCSDHYKQSKQRLFAASPLLQCLGPLGRRVVDDWAMRRIIYSPQDALVALGELFDLFEPTFGVSRISVWKCSVPPRIYRCGPATFSRLWASNDDLKSFLLGVVPQPMGSKDVEDGQQANEDEVKIEKDTLMKVEDAHPVTADDIMTRWEWYVENGDLSIFERTMSSTRIVRHVGCGGSSHVFEGRYGPDEIPVAVKCFILPQDMSHEEYVKESLTSVAFLVLFNQMEKHGVGKFVSLYDFFVTSEPPANMTEESIKTCARVSDVTRELPKLCYLVTSLMDGVIGRFLTEEDDGFDPCYDTLLNSPMSDGEIFQFLYAQLALRALFDCTILDMMLNGQLRGDNLGFAYLPPARLAEPPTSAPRKGILVVFQSQEDTEPRFLCFPEKKTGSGESRDESVRLISFIDLGQGKQPGLQELTKRGLIGETIVESCIQDDGFGRYWPLDRLYCKDIETCGTVARQAIHWGTNVCVDSPQASEAALKELFDLYAPVYGVDPPTEEELHDYVVFRWVPEVVRKIRG